MSWRKVKLGELCLIEKGNIGIQKAIPGEYPMVVTSEERKSHNEFQFDDEAVIIPLVSSTGHGHKSLKRIHFQTGKFAVGSILCAVIPKDKTVLNAEYLYRYLDLKREDELVSRMKGMANVSLPIKEIAQIEIPIPPIEEQRKFVDAYGELESNKEELSTELTHQQNLLKQLRQAFLREAMHRKLLAKANEEFEINVPPDKSGGNSPGGNSKNQLPLALASGQKEKQAKGFSQTGKELLELIKNEKQKLINAGKLKKEKPLPPIKEEEIPFDIPENWVWCRLGEIGKITGGGTPSMANDSYWNGNIPWVSPKDMGEDFVYDTEMKVTKKGVAESSANLIPEGSLLIVGRSGILKRKLPVAINKIECTVNQDMKVIIPYIGSMNRFLQLMLFGLEKIVLKDFVKFGMTVHSLKYEEFAQMPIPLPPLAEQKRIVKKLAELMNLCEELKTTITDNQNYTDQLLQVALKEALQMPAGKAGMKEIEPV